MSTTTSEAPPVCPLSLLLSKLSGPWTLYIIWILANAGTSRFGELRRAVQGISPKVLTERLRMLEAEGIVHRHYEPTIPPQVSYQLSDRGLELMDVLGQLNDLAERWYPELGEFGCSR